VEGNFEKEGLEHEPSLAPAPISFTIPLSEGSGSEPGYALTEKDVHLLNVGEGETAECPGTSDRPEAAPGNLCVYTTFPGGIARSVIVPPSKEKFGQLPEPAESGAGTNGAVVLLEPEAGPNGYEVYGSWAVTAPTS
jgi:hypothetical protein